MLSGLHSLRLAPNEMPSPFSASSGQSTKYLARFSRHRRSAAMALTRCYASRPWSHVVGSFHPSACGVSVGCCSASNQSVVGASRRSAAPGSQSIGSQLLVRSFSAFTHRALPATVEALSCQVQSSGSSSAALAHFGHRGAVPARDAQPFNREDKQRRVRLYCFCQRTAAVVCLSSQTLGITVGRHAFAPPQPSLRFQRNALALLCFFG
jgi:hypothetical protein